MVDLEKLTDTLSGFGQNKYAVVGAVLILALALGVGFIALGSGGGGGQVAGPRSSERLVKLQADDREVSVVLGGGTCGCSTDYFPLCGADGRTYWNECFATCLGAVVEHQGICATAVSFPEGEAPSGLISSSQEIINTVGEGSICGDTASGFNACSEGQCIDGQCQGVDGVNCNGRVITTVEYAANPSACARTGSCGSNINPVCAEGVFTFINLCEAQKAGYANKQLSPGPCEAHAPGAGEQCGVVYTFANGEAKTWFNSQQCAGSLVCSNGICSSGQSYCPDGKPTSGDISECYPAAETQVITVAGQTCPPVPAPVPASQPVCLSGESSTKNYAVDTDDGIDKTKQGTVSGTDREGKLVSGTDKCVDETKVREFYIGEENGVQFAAFTDINCPEGTVCKEGACLPPSRQAEARPPSCTETDGGISLTVAGSVKATYGDGREVERIDQCVGPDAVQEWYCSSGTIKMVRRDCPLSHECSNGACVEISSRRAAGRTSSASVSPAVACVDNDPEIYIGAIGTAPTLIGGNTFVTGTATVTLSNGSRVQYQDACIDPSKVAQAYCSGTDLGGGTQDTCPEGAPCHNGRCRYPNQRCVENSDPASIVNGVTIGGDIAVQGETTVSGVDIELQIPDRCNNNTHVRQFYCVDQTPLETMDACPEGTTCSEGVCGAGGGAEAEVSRGDVSSVDLNVFYPVVLRGSSFVDKAGNLIGGFREREASEVPLLRYPTSSQLGCPYVGSSSGNYANYLCTVSGTAIRGWAELQFDAELSELNTGDEINVRLSQFRAPGGGKVAVFTTADGTTWTKRGECLVPATTNTCTLTIPYLKFGSTNRMRSMLVALESGTSSQGARVEYVSVRKNS